MQEDVSSGPSGIVRDLLVPSVKGVLGIQCRSALRVINDKPVAGFVVKSIIHIVPL